MKKGVKFFGGLGCCFTLFLRFCPLNSTARTSSQLGLQEITCMHCTKCIAERLEMWTVIRQTRQDDREIKRSVHHPRGSTCALKGLAKDLYSPRLKKTLANYDRCSHTCPRFSRGTVVMFVSRTNERNTVTLPFSTVVLKRSHYYMLLYSSLH